jgi:hypothetical protein
MRTAFGHKSFWLGVLLAVCWSRWSKAQGVIGASLPSDTINYDNTLASNFKSGKTNELPLLRLNWFSDPCGPNQAYYRIHWFSLGASGEARAGVSSISNGSVGCTLNKTNLLSLVEAVNRLPEPPKDALPYERQIIISGIRSNQWFRAIYDRATVPKEVREVFNQSGARLDDYTR